MRKHRLQTTIVLSILLLMLFSVFRAPESIATDILFRLRGERSPGDSLVLVYLDSDDIAALGGWPITRDYHGFMIYVLQQAGARVIGFDILFERSDPQYEEYDDAFADFILSAGNVVLPLSFNHLTPPEGAKTGCFQGEGAVVPLPVLQQAAAETGFSNIGRDPLVRSVPLVVRDGDRTVFSFGVALAKQFLGAATVSSGEGNLRFSGGRLTESIAIPLTGDGRLPLNHIGGISRVNSLGFLRLLQAEGDEEDLPDLQGRLVLIAATAPGLPVLRTTPLADLIPAGLIHLTVAENIIRRTYLRRLPVMPEWLLIAGLTLLSFLLFLPRKTGPTLLLFAGTVLIYCTAAFLLFSVFHLPVPLVYPLAGLLGGGILNYFLATKQAVDRHRSRRDLLEAELARKETTLHTAETTLQTLENRLQDKDEQTEETLRQTAAQQSKIRQLEKEVRDLRTYMLPEPEPENAEFAEIIHSPQSSFREVLALVQRIREDDIPVLIEGETGTGKEMIARAIHRTGRRSGKAFVAINCGALPETLLESELFGHEKGSFTGAQNRRRGRFELADGGTVFLDEITETTPAFQARLLRVLQEGTFERLGGEETLKVDVRIIAACNRDLQGEMQANRFRPDLFYRLNGFPIKLPPLRDRREDIPLLANHFLKKHRHDAVNAVSDRAMAALQAYHWPGNVRELENIVRRAAILAQSEGRKLLRISDLPPEITRSAGEVPPEAAYRPLEDQILESLRALKFSRSAISRTAEALGGKDRGTITEYLRGLCFAALAENDFDISRAAAALAASEDPATIERITRKIRNYLDNLRPLPEEALLQGETVGELPAFKGLPQKYHGALVAVIGDLRGEKKTGS